MEKVILTEGNMNINDIELKDEERQKCECWTRVMGYYRPVEAFNVGKKSEYKDRKCYKERICNQNLRKN